MELSITFFMFYYQTYFGTITEQERIKVNLQDIYEYLFGKLLDDFLSYPVAHNN